MATTTDNINQKRTATTIEICSDDITFHVIIVHNYNDNDNNTNNNDDDDDDDDGDNDNDNNDDHEVDETADGPILPTVSIESNLHELSQGRTLAERLAQS